MLRTARLAGDDLASLSEKSARLEAGIGRKEEGKIVFDKKKFLSLPVSAQRHLLRESIEDVLGSLKDIESRHITQIIAAAAKPAGKNLSLPMGLAFTNEYDRFLLSKDTKDLSPFPAIHEECSLKIPGETTFSGWCVTASVIKRDQMKEKEKDNFTVCLSLDDIGDNLTARARKPGDVFQPLGMSQEKEVAEFMIDAKIPRASRPRIPLVCSPEHIVWVVGHRLDDRAKVTPRTKKVLRLEFYPQGA